MFLGIFGGAEGVRTPDLLDAIEARSQLRHGPTGGKINDVAFITPPPPTVKPTLGHLIDHVTY